MKGGLGKLMDELLGTNTMSTLTKMFAAMEWGEDEIKQAMSRHPEHADRLYHTWTVLTPTNHLLYVERTYRSHCRELLGRVAAGEDLRPATAAEMASVMSELSQKAPLRTEAMTVYMRVFQRAFPDTTMLAGEVAAYEHVSKGSADLFEKQLARRLYKGDRVLEAQECSGQHWGVDSPNCLLRKKAS